MPTIKCPAIVEELLFERVALKLKQNKLTSAARSDGKYLLSGLLWCNACGWRCTTFPNHGRSIYRCNNVSRFQYIRHCQAPGIARSRIEEPVWTDVCDLVCDRKRMRAVVFDYYSEMAGGHSDPASLATKLKRLRARQKRAFDVLMNPDNPQDQAQAEFDRIRAEISQIEAEQKRVKVLCIPTPDAIDKVCDQLQGIREVKSIEGRREILLTLVRQIRYFDGQYQVHGNIHIPDVQVENSPNGRHCFRHKRIGAHDNISVITPAAFPFVINKKVA